MHLNRYGERDPEFELDLDDLGEADAHQPYTEITVRQRTSYAAMAGLIGGGALALLVGGPVLGLVAQSDSPCETGGCYYGAAFLGIGVTLVVVGLIVGPREKTVLSIDGYER